LSGNKASEVSKISVQQDKKKFCAQKLCGFLFDKFSTSSKIIYWVNGG